MLNTNLSLDEDEARDVFERESVDFLINRGYPVQIRLAEGERIRTFDTVARIPHRGAMP
jgi:hypothetical protein